MKLIQTEYWNKVIDDPTAKPFGRKILRGEYEIKSRHEHPNAGGWKSWEEIRKSWKRRGLQIDTKNKTARIDNGTYYGIHSYTILEWIED